MDEQHNVCRLFSLCVRVKLYVRTHLSNLHCQQLLFFSAYVVDLSLLQALLNPASLHNIDIEAQDIGVNNVKM
jgi:hypothetical protein